MPPDLAIPYPTYMESFQNVRPSSSPQQADRSFNEGATVSKPVLSAKKKMKQTPSTTRSSRIASNDVASAELASHVRAAHPKFSRGQSKNTSAVPSATPSLMEVHRLRLIDWEPSPVVALAASVDGTAMAAARDDGAIEVWRVAAGSVGWHCELRIPGRKDAAISSLVWCLATRKAPRGRLFSAGLDGHITEWDLGSLAPKRVIDSYGGPVWDMAVEPPAQPTTGGHTGHSANQNSSMKGNRILPSPIRGRGLVEEEEEDDEDEDWGEEEEGTKGGSRRRRGARRINKGGVEEEEEDEEDEVGEAEEEDERIAVACDDGKMRLFGVGGDGSSLEYQQASGRVPGRVLSVVWSCDARRIFAGGSDGCIRCWDVATMREVYRLTAGAAGSPRADDLCVWTLLALRDNTLVSGDGSGCTQFWDGRQGTLLQALPGERKADILALAAGPSHDQIFSAGMDGQVYMYQRVTDEAPSVDAAAQRGASKRGALVPSTTSWVRVGKKHPHTHDVKALAVAVLPVSEVQEGDDEATQSVIEVVPGVRRHGKGKQQHKRSNRRFDRLSWQQQPGVAMLVSGGNDAQLYTYPAESFFAFYPHNICAAPQIPPMHLTYGKTPSGTTSLLVQHRLAVEVWQIEASGSADKHKDGSGFGVQGHSSNELTQDVLRIQGSSASRIENLSQVSGKRKNESPTIDGPSKKCKKGSEGFSEQAPKHVSGMANGISQKRGIQSTPAKKTVPPFHPMEMVKETESLLSPLVALPSLRPPLPSLIAKIKSGSSNHISCSAISPNGRFIAFSDTEKVRLYELEPPSAADQQAAASGVNEKAGLEALWRIRKRRLPDRVPPGHQLTFSADSSKFLVAARVGGIWVVDIEEEGVHRFPSQRSRRAASSSSLSFEDEEESSMEGDGCGGDSLPPPVSVLCTSRDGQWMAAADVSGHVSVYNLEMMRHHWSILSLLGSSITALLFHPSRPELIASTAANQVVAFDLDGRSLSPWSQANEGSPMPAELVQLPGGISGLSMASQQGGPPKLLAYGPRCMVHIDMSQPFPKEPAPFASSLPSLPSPPPSSLSPLRVSRTPSPRSFTPQPLHVNVTKSRSSSPMQSPPRREGSKRRRDSQSSRDTEAKGHTKEDENTTLALTTLSKGGVEKPRTSVRVIPFQDICLFVGHLGERSLLVVEKAWQEVTRKLPAPFAYHRYGT
eukprot:TRINITY_DN16808_c0_g1_i1.p1 TRINITY_DN16808_c0_g1~~TRINITY_DN16808_c0_g1_i1.p1  ORF type:complete len:1190 (+),score=220.21 TRINITY_DN16808_c0_g1_i1:223-3792(+)